MMTIIALMLLCIIAAVILDAIIVIWVGYTIEKEKTGRKTMEQRLSDFGSDLYRTIHKESDK